MNNYQEDPIKEREVQVLIEKALEARTYSYSPYSGFQVGACLEGKSGKLYTGCNIENVGYSPTNCGERTSFFKGVSEGELEFTRIAIVGGSKGEVKEFCSPCGVCLQVMMEFCDPDSFEIIQGISPKEYKVSLLKELLPQGFGPKMLGKKEGMDRTDENV